ncbi:MAG: hypothetical protein GKS04_04695 [Candidatus Mycalebacterium zealandia]|nr:MAG: hypothetical protein GKS04_04695 [Candidatus Mycalebacterium zealandia]
MKPTLIKMSISQDGLLPQQSIELGEALLQNFPKKLMSALDFERVDSSGKKTTFIGIMPVFVVIGEKTQEIQIELTVAHPELRDKVIEIFTLKSPSEVQAVAHKTGKSKPAPKAKSPSKSKPKAKSAPSKPTPKAKPKPLVKKPPAKEAPVKKKKVSKGRKKK